MDVCVRCDYTCLAICVCGGIMKLCIKLREKSAVSELRWQRLGICNVSWEQQGMGLFHDFKEWLVWEGTS